MIRSVFKGSLSSLTRRVSRRSLAASSIKGAGKSNNGSWQFMIPPSPEKRLVLGCVSYDPSVTQIWDCMADYLRTKGGLSGFDYRLFTNYEAQVGALVEGHIDVAWNGPVAHVLTEDLTQEYRPQAQLVSLGQRDVDRDFPTVCLVRKDAVDTDKPKPSHLEELSLATGSSDSPQGHIVPVDWLTHTMDVKPSAIHAYEADLGKHGDTALGEVLALQALVDGKAHAALLSDMMYQRGLQGLLDGVDADSLRQYTTLMDASPPPFDHCIFDAVVTDDQQDKKFQVLSKALLAMDIEDPAATEAMRLEGIKKCWMPPRVDPTGIVRDALHRKGLAQRSFQQSHGVHQSTHRAYCTTSICPQQKVGVIGAGVAGLQTIKALQAKGMDVKAFEAADGVGGLWRENYLSYGVQVPKQLYEFPDFPFDEVPEGKYPTGKQTCDYIKRFAEQHGLLNSIQFQTTVISAVPDEKGHWKVTTVDRTSSIPVSHEFDKLVVATGLYSTANKFVPKAEGINSFLGEVMHSSDFRSANQAKAKKVVVVGGGKSAIDVAVAASASGAAAVTLLSRRPHWPTPRKIADLIPFQYVFLSRLGQNLVLGLSGPLPGCSPPHSSIWHSVGQFVMVPIFKVVELLFALQFRNIIGPTSPFLKCGVVEDFYGYAHVLDYSLRDKVSAGQIDWRIGAIQSFEKDEIVLRDGTRIEADVVVFGTGFQKDYSIFPEETRLALNIESDGLYLYRHTIPPAVPNLAFVGSEVATIMNVTTHGIQATWLAQLWSGEMTNVPDHTTMEKEVQALKVWKRRWMPNTSSRASLVLLHQTHFHDRLMKDMGLEHRRKYPNILAEWFAPYVSRDYNGVAG